MYGIILDICIRCPCYNSFSIPAYTYFTRFLGSQFHKKFIGSQFRKIYCVSEMYELFYVFVSQQSFVYWPVVVSLWCVHICRPIFMHVIMGPTRNRYSLCFFFTECHKKHFSSIRFFMFGILAFLSGRSGLFGSSCIVQSNIQLRYRDAG